MIIDLLATDNYVSFNIKIAESFGLETAVYLTELININNKAKIKNKIDAEGFFTLDRKYISLRTTLPITKQIEIDKKMASLNVFKLSNIDKNKIYFDVEVLAGLIASEDINKLKNAARVVNEKPKSEIKRTQRQMVIEALKVTASHENPELNQAYKEWVDGVYAKPTGFLSNKSIRVFMQGVDDFAKGNLDLALKIIEIATIGGYRDVQWAINDFNKNHKIEFYNNKIVAPPINPNYNNIELSNEVF